MLKYRKPFILLIIISLIIWLEEYIPLSIVRLLFSVSLLIKSFIIFVLPVIIFSLLFSAIYDMKKNASQILIVIILGVVISNFIATSIGYFSANLIYKLDITIIFPSKNNNILPYNIFLFPQIIQNYIPMIFGIILALFADNIFTKDKAEKISIFLSNQIVKKLLNVISMMIPLFIIGFILKLNYDKVIKTILLNYSTIFIIIFFTQMVYIIMLYLLSYNFSVAKTCKSIYNMLPAMISGFTTMSSVASMPITIRVTEKNLQNKKLAHTIVPTTVNIHLIGDCIAIPCLAYAILKTYNIAAPTFMMYFIFLCNVILIKFSAAGIPAGSIIIMLPILEQYFNFNENMISLIVAIYLLFDPIFTAINILANGAFAKIINRIILRLKLI